MRSGRPRNSIRDRWLLAALGAVLAGVGLGFVPTASQALNSKYPPIFRADLSGCERNLTSNLPEGAVDQAKLVRRLLGTWNLQSRTRAGMKAEGGDRITTMHFDVEPLYAGAPGTALRSRASMFSSVEKPRAGSESDTVRPEAFWQVSISRPQRSRVALTMTGSMLDATGAVTPDVHQITFAQAAGVFAAVPGGGTAWDKVVLTHDTLTFVSCRDRLLERYSKTVTGTPTIAGVTLESFWRRFAGGAQPAAEPAGAAGAHATGGSTP